MLTTIDNPYDPRTQYDQWMEWDQDHGYFTSEYFSRVLEEVTGTAEDDVNDEIIDAVIDEIIELNVLGIYKKI